MSLPMGCITCHVCFKTPELQREHYKSDWHKFNLKRKISSAPVVTLEDFNQRLKEQQEAAHKNNDDNSEYCKYCSKVFNTKNAYNNHLNSKKHKLAVNNENIQEEQSLPSDTDSFVRVFPTKTTKTEKFVLIDPNDSGDVEIDSEVSDIEELDSDEWEDCQIEGNNSLIKPSDCLFCDHHSKTMVKNLKHMAQVHSFFIPDFEYCVDVKGLLLYLGEKISQDYMCLWCNEKGKTFYSMESVRDHMSSKGHNKMCYEGLALAEYSSYYDYSSSYPDYIPGDDVDADKEVEGPITLGGDDYELVLPSGAVIGHRSLLRYYKQHLTGNNQIVMKKSDRKVHKVLGVYRALGCSNKEETAIARHARDIHFLKRVQSKWQLKMSMKCNKFQKHYRPQVNF